MAKPPKKSVGDVAHGAVKAGLSLIPYAGSAAAELFNLLLAPPLERRRDEWMAALHEDLRRLKEERGKFSLNELQHNESFVTATLQATRIALQTHQKEKLEALRNAVLNASLPNGLDHDMKAIFMNHIEAMTPWLLKILAWLKDPDEYVQRQGAKLAAVNFVQLLVRDFPELQGRNDFFIQVVNDLRGPGLLTSDTSSRRSRGRDLHGPRTTGLGDMFLAFIASPLDRGRDHSA